MVGGGVVASILLNRNFFEEIKQKNQNQILKLKILDFFHFTITCERNFKEILSKF